MVTFNTDQPAPENKPESEAVWPYVIQEMSSVWGTRIHDLTVADMHERNEIGIKRYGVPLSAPNGRDFLADAYQETLDAAVYLRGALMDDTMNETVSIMLTESYMQLLDIIQDVRWALDKREEG